MSVVESVRRDLERFSEEAQESALAAAALSLAAGLDSENSLTSKSMAAKSLMDVMRELRSLAPPKQETDGVDDLTARRQKRRTGSATA